MARACSIVRSRESTTCVSTEKENAHTDTEVDNRSTRPSDAKQHAIDARSEGCIGAGSGGGGGSSCKERSKFCRTTDAVRSPLQVGHNLKIQPWNAHAWPQFPRENRLANPETRHNAGVVDGVPVPKLVVGYSIGKAVSVIGVPRRRLSRDEYARVLRRQLAQRQLAAVEEIRAVLRANPGWKLKRVKRKNGKTCWTFDKSFAVEGKGAEKGFVRREGSEAGDDDTHTTSETDTERTTSQNWAASERR